ncbi:MAG: hypothetical protein PHS79_06095 [Patescibacteria group bacterium]|nr:hypothetical protein [Patescibacteria group bacterium]
MKKFLIPFLILVIVLFGIQMGFALTSPQQTPRDKQLMVDGDMEMSGTSAWSVYTAVTITKEAGAAVGGESILRLQATGTGQSRALQAMFVVGKRYRITGYARSDGTRIPSLFSPTSGYLWTGTNGTTTWQMFDVVTPQIAAGSFYTRLLIGTASNGSIADYTEWDDITVTEYTGYVQNQDTQKLADGDMEMSGTSAWTAGAGAVCAKGTTDPKSGRQYLQVSGVAVFNDCRQSVLTAGKRYRVTGWARGNGVASVPTISFGGSNLFVGTASTAWQKIDVIGVAANQLLRMYYASAVGYAEFDEITVTEYKGEMNVANHKIVNEQFLYSSNVVDDGCTLIGAPTISNGMDLTGVTGKGISCATYLPKLKALTNATIIAKVVVPTATAYRTLTHVREGATTAVKFEVGINQTDNKMYFYSGATVYTSTNVVTAGTTQYLAWTISPTTVTYYNGTNAGTLAQNGTSAATFGSTSVGQSFTMGIRSVSNTYDWQSNIYYLEIFDQVLTLDQIKQELH